MTDNTDLKKLLCEQLSVSPDVAGRAFGLGRSAAYGAVRRGEIPAITLGKLKRVPTSWIRERLGLDTERAA